ncbi:hypothetical protein AVEN_33641-1 [Araneus ventricosus]|uniref:Uncharacterized protein n=1 Tax=Araneus ventricosus TaxID=182803 RepID=A0A4Y2FT98_ARAVE|nr:hypothetical protein AVEN_33641-1 [Araneus ventricosus]
MVACWSFHATSHEKAVCGGIGGTVKRTVAKKNLQSVYQSTKITNSRQRQEDKAKQVLILNCVFDGILLKGAESAEVLQRLEPSLHNSVACVYEENWWIELVSELNKEEGDYTIAFMHPHGPSEKFY